jgi:hypothetical protein
VLSGGYAVSTIVESGGVVSVSGALTQAHLLPGGAIDLLDFAFSAGATTTFDSSTDVLTISAGSATTDLQLSGDYTGEYFHVVSGPDGGVAINVDDTPCYCAGTLILTDRGEREVESLNVGDRLVTASGNIRPIKWIGRRGFSAVFARGNRRVLPVLIRQGALGDGLPRRDLLVSPLHAMFLDGLLIPAGCLLNGTSILQPAHPDPIAYFHLELETHDIILAEGALAESYVDACNRAMFHNAAEHAARCPDAVSTPALYCAPRVEDGPELQAVHRRLARSGQALHQAAA